MNNNKKEAMRWFGQAEYDWKAAKHSADGHFHSTACFQSQQAAEKAIKAYLTLQGRRAIMGHSIVYLIREAVQYNSEFEQYLSHGRILDRYYIPTRYPDALPDGMPYESYEKEDAEIALDKSKKIINTIQTEIDKI